MSILRRDRRAEWIQRNRLHPLHKALLSAEVVYGPSGLVRKNPHAQYFVGPNGVKRINRSASPAQYLVGNSVRAGTATKNTEPSLPMTLVENPDFYIAIVLDFTGGRLTAHDKDVLGQAHKMVQSLDDVGAVLAIVFAGSDSDIKEDHFDVAGVDRLIKITGEVFGGYSPEAKIAALVDIEKNIKPLHWLFPDSIAGGNELGCRLAAKLGERPATQAWQVSGEDCMCRAQSGTVDVTLKTPRIILLAEECAEPIDETRHEVKLMPADTTRLERLLVNDLGSVDVDPKQIPLAEAAFILSAGNGVQNWPQFHQAADILAATEGASRVAVDNGFMARDRQVGASGTWVSAKVYVAIGISGAIQHLQGIGQCEKVVAINTDAGCDMVKRSDLAVIGDCEEILEALVNLVKVYQASQDSSSSSGGNAKLKGADHAA